MAVSFIPSKGLIAAAALALSLAGLTTSAKAQTIFCPSSVATTDPADVKAISGITLTAGACTNPGNKAGVNAGAYSGAALAGQAVGSLAQSMSNVETVSATQSIQGRRETEAAACPPGQSLIDGVCRPPAAVPRTMPEVRPAAAAPAPVKVARPLPAPRRKLAPKPAPAVAASAEPVPVRKTVKVAARRRPIPMRKPPAPEMVEPAPFMPPPPLVIAPAHFGAWAQGFGDYEERSGKSSSVLQCCTAIAGVPLNLEASSKTTSEGFLGGIDWTKRDFIYGGDGLILGVMGGYMESDVKVNTSVLSTVPPGPGSVGVSNGFGTLKAHLSGPSVGAYATYFNGPWSNDFLIKNDFLDLSESFSGLQAYQTCNCFPDRFVPFTTTFSGSGKASLDEFTVSDNLNYRIPLMSRLWMEPTAGVQYTLSSYSNGASALGLKDGDQVRLQAGSRFGIDGVIGDTKVTTTLTGLAYDDVLVSGNFIQGGVFGTSGNILSDEGKLRGEGILAVKFDFGGGKSAFLQGDVRGGDGLFGAGGKGGFRFEW